MRLDRKDYDKLLNLVDQMINTSEPRRAEYYRGYRSGIQAIVHGTQEESVQAHFSLLHDASDGDHADPYLEAYARGYRDGCRGMKPEDTP